MNKEIGSFISELRKEQGMTQQELANKLHVTKQAVSKWECDKSLPDITLIEQLAKILNVSVVELLHGERKAEDYSLSETNSMTQLLIKEAKKKIHQQQIKTILITCVVCVLIAVGGLYLNDLLKEKHNFTNSNFQTCVLIEEREEDAYLYMISATDQFKNESIFGTGTSASKYQFYVRYENLDGVQILSDITRETEMRKIYQQFEEGLISEEEYHKLASMDYNLFVDSHPLFEDSEQQYQLCQFPEGFEIIGGPAIAVELKNQNLAKLIHDLYGLQLEIDVHVGTTVEREDELETDIIYMEKEIYPKLYSEITQIIIIEE